MKNKKMYIAYGSNINLEQMSRRCPRSKPMETAMLKGYELQFKYHATIAENPKSELPVLFWELDPQDEKILDRYEGFPKYYSKETMRIKMDDKEFDAMVYIMNNDGPLRPPAPEYYEIIEKGYKENGLDTAYLDKALKESLDVEYGLSQKDGSFDEEPDEEEYENEDMQMRMEF